MSLKKFLTHFRDARPVSPSEVEQLWNHPAFKRAVKQLEEDLKEGFVFSDSPEQREDLHRQLRTLQLVAEKLQQIYHQPGADQ